MKIILAILIVAVSLIYGLPNLILLHKYKNNYTPFTLKGSPIARDEAFAYAPEVRYELNNKSLLKEVYVEEYKDSPTPFMGETAPSAVLAIFAKLTGSLESAFIVADFILPPIFFVIFFKIAKLFIKNKYFALASAFVATISRDFITVLPYPAEIIKYLTVQENQNYLLYFSRAFHPQVSLLFLAAALLAVFSVVNKQSILNIFLLGVSIGVLFYSYVFYWTLFGAFYALLCSYMIWKKEYKILNALVIGAALAIPIALPYLLNMIHFYSLDTINDFVTKSSLHNVPIPLMLIRFLLISIILLVVVKKRDLNLVVFVSFLFGGILITPLSKILIGQDLETLHYLRRAVMPFATIASFIIIYNLIKNKSRLLTIISTMTIVVFWVYGIRVQLIATNLIQNNHIRNSDMEQTMDWLNKNTNQSAVIGSLDPDFSSLIPVYTDHRVFMPPTDRTVLPTYEGIERYKILSELLGVDSLEQKNKLDDLVSYFFVYQSYDEDRSLDTESPRRQQAEKQMDELSKDSKWKDSLSQVKLDYIVVTPKEKLVKPDLSKLEAKTSINEYIIFQYK